MEVQIKNHLIGNKSSLKMKFSKIKLLHSLISALCFTCIHLNCLAQVTDLIPYDFDSSNQHLLQEKIYMHTDKNFYLEGEIIWFKLYCVKASNNKLSFQSKVAFVELLDAENKVAAHCKIELEKGKGDGYIHLSNSIKTGMYKLRSYTNWMKNFGPDVYYEDQLTVINTLKKPDWASFNKPDSFNIQLFPEGGTLVNGIESKIGFKLSDQYESGNDGYGYVLNERDDTLVHFKTSKFGRGNFKITPAASSHYRVIAYVQSHVVRTVFPEIMETGCVISVEKNGANYLSVTGRSKGLIDSTVYLIVHNGYSIHKALQIRLVNNSFNYLLNLKDCPDGISEITLFNKYRQPICERLVLKFPDSTSGILLNTDKTVYETRSKVEVSLIANADLSLSVYLIDSIQQPLKRNILNYLLLTSELRGTIEFPDYYFQHQDDTEAIENLLLTNGWRKFASPDLINNQRQAFHFIPEYEGLLVSAKVLSGNLDSRYANKLMYLSAPGQRFELSNGILNDSGNVIFIMKNIYGLNEVIVQPANPSDSSIRLNLLNPYSEQYSTVPVLSFQFPERWKDILSHHSLNAQVQNAYSKNDSVVYVANKDSSYFYSTPDASYLLDDYTRFPTMEEVLREFVNKVRIRKVGSSFHFQAWNIPYKDYFNEDAFVILDGVPVSINKIMQFDPLKIRKIDIVARKYYYGNDVYNGIVSFTTYSGDLANFELDPQAIVLEYEGLQLKRQFSSPDYSISANNKRNIPDRRNVLLWSPEIKTDHSSAKINFYTSDIPGSYLINLQGIDEYGKPIVMEKFISVRNQ
ncbi:MAG TPA: hypothetical protein VFQ58_04085 [Flavisolibacter sp.]|nr:hypothetical protein [Flavisolibacter sp.]